MIRTPCGLIHENIMLPYGGQPAPCGDPYALLPTDVGSRIGVLYVPTGDDMADMHLICNGEDLGPCSRGIPFTKNPIFAVVDIYGSTKRVSIVQHDGGELPPLKFPYHFNV